MANLGSWGQGRLTLEGAKLIVEAAQVQGLLAKSAGSVPRWSLATLQLDEAACLALREWYEKLAPETVSHLLDHDALVTAAQWTSGTVVLPSGAECFGLVFLALAVETVRREGGFGGLWHCVANLPCHADVRRLLWGGDQPSARLKPAILRAADRFQLRNARDSDGAMGGHVYYGTVLLNVGVPERTYAELATLPVQASPSWLSVRALLEPGEGDTSFREFWFGLGKALRSAKPGAQPTWPKEILASRWFRPTYAATPAVGAAATSAVATAHEEPIGPLTFRLRDGTVEAFVSLYPIRWEWAFPKDRVVDLFFDDEKRQRYTLHEADGRSVARPATAELVLSDAVALRGATVELRSRRGERLHAAGVFSSLELPADPIDGVVEVPTNVPGTIALVVDSASAPTVECPGRAQRWGTFWVVWAPLGTSVAIDGQLTMLELAKIEMTQVRPTTGRMGRRPTWMLAPDITPRSRPSSLVDGRLHFFPLGAPVASDPKIRPQHD